MREDIPNHAQQRQAADLAIASRKMPAAPVMDERDIQRKEILWGYAQCWYGSGRWPFSVFVKGSLQGLS